MLPVMMLAKIDRQLLLNDSVGSRVDREGRELINRATLPFAPGTATLGCVLGFLATAPLEHTLCLSAYLSSRSVRS
jgi:hypothetical protein